MSLIESSSLNEVISSRITKDPPPTSSPSIESIESQIQKLQNRISNFELDISTNRSHVTNLIREFIVLLHASELVLFDLLCLRYLSNDINNKIFGDYIEVVRSLTFSLTTATDADIMETANYIFYLHSSISNSVEALNDKKQITVDVPKRANDLLNLLSSIKNSLDHQLQDSRKLRKENTETNSDNEPTNIVLEIPSISEPKNKLDEQFIQWVTTNIQPDVMESNEKLSQLRTLIGNISYRIENIQKLQKDISLLKENIVDPDDLNPHDYNPDCIRTSPFYEAAIDNCIFVREALRSIQNQKMIMENCEIVFERATKSIAQLSKSCQETIDTMKKNETKMKQALMQQLNRIANLRKEIDQYALILNQKNMHNQYHESQNAVNSMIHELNALLQASKDTDPDAEVLSSTFSELSDMMEMLNETCDNTMKARNRDALSEMALFTYVGDYLAPTEKDRIYQREVNQQQEYRESLIEIKSKLKRELIDSWCDAFNQANTQLQDALIKKSSVNSALAALMEDEDSIDEEIIQLEKEIMEVDDESKAIDDVIIQAQIDLETNKEELFKKYQEVEIYHAWMGNKLDARSEAQLQIFKTALICKNCKKDVKCDTVIAICNHAFCNECVAVAEGEVGHCPQCGVKYSHDDLVSIFFN